MMPMLKWFDTTATDAFARELAAMMVADLQGENLKSLGSKGLKRAHRAMDKGARKVQEFRTRHRLNFYTRSRLANKFLWSLKEAGWPAEYATQMTEWLTLRL